jgi:hypothetical protein
MVGLWFSKQNRLIFFCSYVDGAGYILVSVQFPSWIPLLSTYLFFFKPTGTTNGYRPGEAAKTTFVLGAYGSLKNLPAVEVFDSNVFLNLCSP